MSDLGRVTKLAEECGIKLRHNSNTEWWCLTDSLLAFEQAVCKQKDEEIERLNALLAMQSKALKYAIDDLIIRAKLNEDDALNIGQGCLDDMNAALNATQADVAAWEAKKKAEIEKDLKLRLADYFESAPIDHAFAIRDEIISFGGVK